MIGVPLVLKLLSPKIVKGIIAYVFDRNELDDKVDVLIKDVGELRELSHPPIFETKDKEMIEARLKALEEAGK